MDVSIVIINYNTYELTRSCVAAVLKHTRAVDYEVIVVDNASDLFDQQGFEAEFPNVNIIRSDKNLGFAGGNNLGIREAKGKYILLLNSDAFVKDNVTKALYDHMEKNIKAAAVSPKLEYPDGRHQSVCQRFPSIRYQLFELLRLQKIFPKKIRGKILLGAFFDHGIFAKPDWIWGACFMFRKSLLEELPGKKLDEQYFMYCEDMQWCFDMRKLGYEIHYYAESTVIHLMGGSSGAKEDLISKNNEDFIKRNYSSIHRVFIKGLRKILVQ